jgi:hypothetical protein
MVRVRFLAGARDFFPIHSVRTGSGVHPASYPMGILGILSLRIKKPGREADHSPPCSADVKNGGAIHPLIL